MEVQETKFLSGIASNSWRTSSMDTHFIQNEDVIVEDDIRGDAGGGEVAVDEAFVVEGVEGGACGEESGIGDSIDDFRLHGMKGEGVFFLQCSMIAAASGLKWRLVVRLGWDWKKGCRVIEESSRLGTARCLSAKLCSFSMDSSGPTLTALQWELIHRRSSILRHHRIRALLLTFVAYAAFHASRKPPSIVKSVLAPDPPNSTSSSAVGWTPFDGKRGPHRLGELDLAFLSSYSVGMYLTGHAADILDLRLFLSGGMIGSCIATAAFGFAYWLDVHRLWFFLAVQVTGGLVQSIGWPCVVAVVTNWFGDASKRGLIMGIWNSHTSVGNILGSVLASCFLNFGWGWSYVVPALLIGICGVLVFAFLVAHPRDLELMSLDFEVEMNPSVAVNDDGLVENLDVKGSLISEKIGLLHTEVTEGKLFHCSEGDQGPIGFLEAWRLPGVAPYACCLFFSKLVAYTFVYWLPFYIRNTAVAGEHPTHRISGILSTIFDIGGVFGGVSAGFLSDLLSARAITSAIFLLLAIPAMIFYRMYGNLSMRFNIALMFLSGFFVNGPYSLITTAVAADLGTQDLIRGNTRALATVTAIIDGTGSIGAALGPLFTGYMSTRGWNNVFIMLIFSNLFAIMCLIQLVKAEFISKKRHERSSIG